MNRLFRVAILTFTAAIVLVIGSPQLQAKSKWQSRHPQASSGQTSQTKAQPTRNALYRSYFTQADDIGLYEDSDEDLPLDSLTTIVCPSAGGCTLEIEQSISVGGVDSEDNWCGPFVQVDGNWTNYGPPAGETPTDESFMLTGSIQTTTLKKGNHTVQSFIYSYYGLYVWSYHITYRVYVTGTPVTM